MRPLTMLPATGERLLRFVGDRVRFRLSGRDGVELPRGWPARLRTNLGRAATLRAEIVNAHLKEGQLANASWHDLPMERVGNEWSLELPLIEVGYFSSKAYAIDPEGKQHWPAGPDVGITVHPDRCRSANTIYCAFTRLFGETKAAFTLRNEAGELQLKTLEKQGHTVIPASGKLRDLIQQLPHIVDTLGCRILHLLPINPVPTTYARFGRYGSPYACQDFTAIDPALVEFDRRTTGVDQFCELSFATHLQGARLFLDLVINHTGWGSTLQENHPEWFLRSPDGSFVSPGAWGIVWEDLVELDHRIADAWEYLAEVFLIWCRRGVDGFRCDAGYKVPTAAWQFIIARVRQEFPETIFLLEGLGGAWELTENLLTEGGMQWAYSELFQNYSGVQVAGYLDHSLHQSQRVGILVHYGETHDNNRLASKGRAWSALRNRLSALTSVSGGFGFTCGVEWLATEKILVHQCSGLAWDNPDNLVSELGQLNRLLSEHPCFFDGAVCTRLSPVDSPVLALRRDSAEGADRLLVLANTDVEESQTVTLSRDVYRELGAPRRDLLGQSPLKPTTSSEGDAVFVLGPGACYCLAASAKPKGLSGDDYRNARARSAWALTALGKVLPLEEIGAVEWQRLAHWVNSNPAQFLAAIGRIDRGLARDNLESALRHALNQEGYPPVVLWTLADCRRITLVPSGHWLLIQDETPFRATLDRGAPQFPEQAQSIKVKAGHLICFAPRCNAGEAQLTLERYGAANQRLVARVRFLAPRPKDPPRRFVSDELSLPEKHGTAPLPDASAIVLLTNGRGGMARLCVDFGRVKSKYDCLLGANLHPTLPVDRHVLAKRARVWVIADGFITPLNRENLISLEPGPPARWRFVAGAGDGRAVEIHIVADMPDESNTTVLLFHRPQPPPAFGNDLPPECDVRLTVRVDIEDRNVHAETKRNPGAEHHFSSHCRPLESRIGFEFSPASDRRLQVFSSGGRYHHEAEWCENIPHPVELSRGQVGSGDAYSPGWFDLPLAKDESVNLFVTADSTPYEPRPLTLTSATLSTNHAPSPLPSPPVEERVESFLPGDQLVPARAEVIVNPVRPPPDDLFGRHLAQAARMFVVRRGEAKTVIAGYPWFLDWGRDSLISARGLLSAGMVEEVQQLLIAFGQLERDGTLPNTLYGENSSNRETSDAPLWYGVVCEEAARQSGPGLYEIAVDNRGRTIADVIRDIAAGYIHGTPNGIRMDAASGLVWSPEHFTWMDTNYPAGTPREGYPVEIQALWIQLLRQLDRLQIKPVSEPWNDLARRAEFSLQKFFWLDDRGYLADLLIAPGAKPAASAVADNALRSNFLFAISFGSVSGERARRGVDAAVRHLLIPGALRSLAPLPVTPPLPIYSAEGRLLNKPEEPYCGTYEGDEDARRKPAYHNGTAWTWTLPVFCEALARAWDSAPAAVAAAKAYLGSVDRLLTEGCLGQLPEILDGDAPHQQRGCDAQAWSVTETLRVWTMLNVSASNPQGDSH